MMKNKDLWDSLLEPINPHLCVLLGFLNIAFGVLGLMPGASGSPVYSFLDAVAPAPIWAIISIAVGVMLVSLHKWGKTRDLVVPMWINGILWAFQATVVLFSDWNSSGWLIMGFIAVYSLFVAANFKVNFRNE